MTLNEAEACPSGTGTMTIRILSDATSCVHFANYGTQSLLVEQAAAILTNVIFRQKQLILTTKPKVFHNELQSIPIEM